MARTHPAPDFGGLGISSQRLLPPFARQRFSTWFKQRAKVRVERRHGRVGLFQTCTVEYQVPAVGKDEVAGLSRGAVAPTTRRAEQGRDRGWRPR